MACSPGMRRSSLLVQSSVSPGQALRSADSSGAASSRCSRLSSKKHLLPYELGGEGLERALSRLLAHGQGLGDRQQHERGISERGEEARKDAVCVVGKALFACSAGQLESEAGLPLPSWPGHREQTRLLQEQACRDSSSSLPRNEEAGLGRFVLAIVLSGGKERSPSW